LYCDVIKSEPKVANGVVSLPPQKGQATSLGNPAV
jgi:hypothetical protein